MNRRYDEINAIYELVNNNCNLNKFKNKSFFITGSTGIIGSAIVETLCKFNEEYKLNIKILLLVRDLKKAKIRLGKSNVLNFILGSVEELPKIDMKLDYIIHAASMTSSKSFINKPVEVINTAIKGTMNILELAKEKKIDSMIYLSTMEIYGAPDTDIKITEDSGNNINTTDIRSCYPESKRMCENLCCAYKSEFDVPVKIARLTQTFGPGVSYNDERVFAEFARCVLAQEDIILRTKGDTRRSYLYVYDAVSAILLLLLKGKNGESYNVANEETYCSIKEMAQLVSNLFVEGKIRVIHEIDENIYERGYAPTLHMNLDTSKLKLLGWKATVDLKGMMCALIDDWKNMKLNIN